jgi:hypothetical protein
VRIEQADADQRPRDVAERCEIFDELVGGTRRAGDDVLGTQA